MQTTGKTEMSAAVDEVKQAVAASLEERSEEQRAQAAGIVKALEEDILRRAILDEGKRLDGRAFDEIRPVTCEVAALPRTHGSAVFTRGETQALVVTTLAPLSESQRLDWVHGSGRNASSSTTTSPPSPSARRA